jgi:hypothetical protein
LCIVHVVYFVDSFSNDFSSFEIGGTNFESDKRKCRVENDVIELGEEGYTNLSTPKKKALITKNKDSPQKPKMAAL